MPANRAARSITAIATSDGSAAALQAKKRSGARVSRQANTRATSAYISHAAREPASRIGISRNTNATIRPRRPNTLARGDQHERREHGQHRPELEIAGTEDAGQAFGFHRTGDAVAGEDLHPGIEQPEHDDRSDRRNDARPHGLRRARPGTRSSKRQKAQKCSNRAPGLCRRDRVRRGNQRRQPVAGEQHTRQTHARIRPTTRAVRHASASPTTAPIAKRRLGTARDRQQHKDAKHEQRRPRRRAGNG